MTTENDVYDKLAAMVGAPGSGRFAKILEAMVKPEEATLMVELRQPLTADQLAQKLNKDPQALQPVLDDMAKRRIINAIKGAYVTPNNLVMFHHGAIGNVKREDRPRVFSLWGDFFYAEWCDMLGDGYIKRYQSGGTPTHRIVPAHRALELSPNIPRENILWYEDVKQVLQRSERTNMMMCGCRGLWRKCDNSPDVCVGVQFPGPAGRPLREPRPPTTGIVKDLDWQEALEIVHDCENRGLVHIPLNISQADLYCNCCNDCCVILVPLIKRGMVHEVLSPSRYRATVNRDLCNGCQTCVDRCYFDAVEMTPAPGSKKLNSGIIAKNCMGCGSCVIACPQKALTLELVRPPEHIPTVSAMELMSGR